jgi:hypothetical protein
MGLIGYVMRQSVGQRPCVGANTYAEAIGTAARLGCAPDAAPGACWTSSTFIHAGTSGVQVSVELVANRS